MTYSYLKFTVYYDIWFGRVESTYRSGCRGKTLRKSVGSTRPRFGSGVCSYQPFIFSMTNNTDLVAETIFSACLQKIIDHLSGTALATEIEKSDYYEMRFIPEEMDLEYPPVARAMMWGNSRINNRLLEDLNIIRSFDLP